MRLDLLLNRLSLFSPLAVVPGAASTSGGTREAIKLTPIPSSVQAEHKKIHQALVAATRLSDSVGVAARELADVLHPHFVREEEIALPPLGLLAPLAAGGQALGTEFVLEMTDQLRRELPQMLEEHVRIRAAVERLSAVARAEGNVEVQHLAEELALHARTEEEVLYPAAILVGDVIRMRRSSK